MYGSDQFRKDVTAAVPNAVRVKRYSKWHSFLIGVDDLGGLDFDEFAVEAESKFNTDRDISAEAISEDMFIISVDPKKAPKVNSVRTWLQNSKKQGGLDSFTEEIDFVVTERDTKELEAFDEAAQGSVAGSGVTVTYNGENVTIAVEADKTAAAQKVQTWLDSIKG